MTTARSEIKRHVRSRLQEIAVERERLRSVKEEKYLCWREVHFNIEGVEFKELNAAIDALAVFEEEQGLYTE